MEETQKVIDFKARISRENAYIELLKEELRLSKELAKGYGNKHNSTLPEKIKRVEIEKKCLQIEVEIASKMRFVQSLEQHVKRTDA